MFSIGDIWRFGLLLGRFVTESSKELAMRLASALSWLANHTLIRWIALLALLLMLVGHECNRRNYSPNMAVSKARENGKQSYHNDSITDDPQSIFAGVTTATTKAITNVSASYLEKRYWPNWPTASSPVAATIQRQVDLRKRVQASVEVRHGIGVYGTQAKGIGIDYAPIRLGLISVGLGAGWDFSEKAAEAQIEVGYNLKKITHGWTQNTSVFAGHDLRKWVLGLRVDL